MGPGFVCLFVEGPHTQSSHFLHLNCWIQKARVAFGLMMTCNAVNNGPRLAHLRDSQRPLGGR